MEGQNSADGFVISRIISTDPAAYLDPFSTRGPVATNGLAATDGRLSANLRTTNLWIDSSPDASGRL